MDGYFFILTTIDLFVLGFMCLLTKLSESLNKKQKRGFFLAFALIAAISVLEVVLSGLQGHRGFVSRYTKEDRAKALGLLETSGIGETARSPIGEVSGGQMQRALLCRAVISDPKLLILDEPANFVDNKFENELYRTLRELNGRMAIVMVSHDIGTITSVVKEIVCVNRRVHRHRSNVLTEEQLRNYDCPIQLVSHGHIPHTVLEHHPGDGCCDHDSVR